MEARSQGPSITVIEEIREVAKLQTVEIEASAQFTEKKTDWAGASATAVVSAKGTVVASVNLEQMEIEVDDVLKIVTLALPAEVEVARPTHDDFDLQEARHGVFPPWFTDEEKREFINRAFEMIAEEAEAAGIRDLARAKAQEFLTGFVNSLGYEVRFVEP